MEPTKKTARFVLLLSIVLSILTLSSCNSSSDAGSTTTDIVANTSGAGELESTIPPTVVTQYTEAIETIAGNSSCASYSWTGRGKAPAGYIKGMALTYARSYCRYKASQNVAAILSGAAGSSSTDALALFSSQFTSAGLTVSPAGAETLRSLYTLGIGLAMRESSGKYCEGRDMSASNTSASTAEAGMFQTSYDSMNASSELSNLYAEYKAHTDKCYLDVYKVGVSCSASSISGTGEGATYQAMNKSCPAFAAEYAMVMLRVRRNHYGPINRQEAEVKVQCNEMLKSVQDLIDGDAYACDDLL